MSADNYIGVYKDNDLDKWVVCHGFASVEMEDCQYRGSTTSTHDTREEALVAAHDQYKKEYIVEYGVSEMPALPQKFCGRCFICVKERDIVRDDIQRCGKCGEPFIAGDTMVSSIEQNGWVHRYCDQD